MNKKNPIIEDLLWRHTAKKYDSTKKIPQEDLDILFEAMRLTPSSINSQPWKFIVLESDEAKERMSKTFKNKFQFNQPHITESALIILLAYNPYYKKENYDEVIENSIEDKRLNPENKDEAFGAFMFAELNTDANGYNGVWTRAQTYIVLGNMLHTLSRLKIDSTAMEGIDTELVNKEFANELDGYYCELAVAIGYHHKDDYNAKLPKSRRKANSVFLKI